jgi:hypothetical protein
MRTKNVVNDERENEEAQNRAPVPFQKRPESGFRFRLS